jgi:hypothetical protein
MQLAAPHQRPRDVGRLQRRALHRRMRVLSGMALAALLSAMTATF